MSGVAAASEPDDFPAANLPPGNNFVVQPGFEGVRVIENPVFASRAERIKVTSEQLFFDKAVYAAEACQRQGWAVTVATLRMVNDELPARQLGELLVSDKFLHALESRGIPLMHTRGTTPEQNAALAVYFDMSTPATHAQKLKIAGVSRAKWEGWLRQPAFAQRYNSLAEDILKATTPVALQRLGQHVDQGNLKAIELTLEMTGRHDRRKETVDISQVLLGIFAVLDEHVDAETMKLISARIKQTMGAETPNVLQIQPYTPPAGTIDTTEEV